MDAAKAANWFEFGRSKMGDANHTTPPAPPHTHRFNFFHFSKVFKKYVFARIQGLVPPSEKRNPGSAMGGDTLISAKRSPMQQIQPHTAECSQLSGGGDIQVNLAAFDAWDPTTIQVNWLFLLYGFNVLPGWIFCTNYSVPTTIQVN